MNGRTLVSFHYNSAFHLCLLTYLNLTSSARREVGADLFLGFLRPELRKASEGVGGKEGAKLNEKLKSKKLKIKVPQIDGNHRSSFGIQESRGKDLKSWESRARERPGKMSSTCVTF